MVKYVWQFSVSLPGGKYAVVAAEVPFGAKNIYDKLGQPKREYWTFQKIFKRKVNADKCYERISKEQRNHNLTQQLIRKGLINLN